MTTRSQQITLTLSKADRDLIREHGFPLEDAEAALDAVPDGVDVAEVRFGAYDVEMLLGQLAHAINHGTDAELCERLNELYESIEGESGL